MRNNSRTAIFPASCALVVSVFSPMAHAQFGRGGGTWNTGGADAQRSSWARTDNRISTTSMPAFQFLWKVKVSNDAKQQYSLSSAVMVDSYIGYRGFRSYAFLGGASNNAIALDTDMGRVEWTQNFGAVSGQNTAACPGAMTAGVTRTAQFAPAAAPAAGGRGAAAGRGGRGAASGVGEPEAGAITIGQGGNQGRGGPAGASGGRGGAPVAAAAASGGRGPGGGGFTRPPEAVYAVSSDGMLRTMYISNGQNAKPPVKFLPANAHATGLIFVDNVIYAATTGNCTGVPNGIWAMDTSAATPAPMHWATNGGGVVGTVGPAFGADGTVYAATGDGDYSPASFSDSVVALETRTLKLKDWFTPGKSEFVSSPVVFQMKEGETTKDLVAVVNRNGNLYVLDSAALGGADHRTPLASMQLGASDAGALASWEDSAGVRWLLAASNNAVVACKVTLQGGKASLQTGWTSPNIASPLPPIVINGIVFTASGGGGNSVLYALDGTTGKQLFTSGTTIAGSIPRTSNLAGSAGQIYLSTADSTIYAFGVPLVSPALAAKTTN